MSTTIDQKRGLIYTVFRDLLDEERASRAVSFWDTWDAPKQASFTPLRFMQAVQAELDLSTDLKRQLIQRMIGHKVSEERAEETPAEPTPQSEGTKPNMAPSIESEQYIIFTALLYPLLTRLRLSERQFLERIHPKERSDVKSLLEGSRPMMRPPERVMVDCLDHVYELLCDAFGPVKTDQIIARSVTQAEQLPEADLFPPRNLL